METTLPLPRRKHAADDLDPVRHLILSRSRDQRLTLADMSRGAGKNHSYMHQFLYRRTPRDLPEGVRRRLAALLDIPEAQLRGEDDDAGPPGAAAPHLLATGPARSFTPSPPLPRLAVPDAREAGGVPVFMDIDAIIPGQATEWAIRPGPIAATPEGAIGLCISRSRGRFRPGDQVFIRPRHPPRVGDAVVAIRGQMVEAIGDLTELSDESASIQDGGGAPKTVYLDGLRLVKIAAAYFA